MTKIGFLGFGNMATAIAKGLIQKGNFLAENIFAYDILQDKLQQSCEIFGTNPCASAEELVQKSDLVIVAVKPYQVEKVLKPLQKLLDGKVILSIAAGIYFEDLEKIIPNSHHISTIPNTPVSVGEGIFICEKINSLSAEEFAMIKEILSPISEVIELDTELFNIGGTLAGCGPAFAAMFIEALADAGVKNGLPRAFAYRLASKMLAGTAKMQLETQTHPAILKDTVCSPGGTTIRGVAALEEFGMRNAVIKAIDASTNG